MRNLAQALSILFHPIWMPMVGTYVLLNFTQYLDLYSDDVHRIIYIIVFTSTIGLPLLMFPLYIYRKKIKGLELNERAERFIPLLVMAIFYFFSFYTLQNLNTPVMLNAFVLGIFIATVLTLAANFILKISLHAVGLGGITALLLYIPTFDKGNTELILMQALFFSGVVFSARIYLEQHTLRQISVGYAVGLISMFFTLILFI